VQNSEFVTKIVVDFVICYKIKPPILIYSNSFHPLVGSLKFKVLLDKHDILCIISKKKERLLFFRKKIAINLKNKKTHYE
jgi:hypothetical protein